MRIFYFDNCATTPLAPEVFEIMKPYFSVEYGNASSRHIMGNRCGDAVSCARQRIARSLGCLPEEVYFTSGGTESDNWALFNAATSGKKHIISSTIEHKAILSTLASLEKHFDVEFTLLPVDKMGRVNPDDLHRAIRPDTSLVSIMTANNEVGTVQPVKALARIAHEYGVPFHTDAVQAVGKLPLGDIHDFDMVSISAHKFYGPKGIGIFYARQGTSLVPLIGGGAQESGLRGGTTNTPLVMGLSEALSNAVGNQERLASHLNGLEQRFIQRLSVRLPNLVFNGHPQQRVPGVLNVQFPGLASHDLVAAMSERGICASTGSACSESSTKPSYVLKSMGLGTGAAHSSVRFSFGRYTTLDDIDEATEVIPEIVRHQQKLF